MGYRTNRTAPLLFWCVLAAGCGTPNPPAQHLSSICAGERRVGKVYVLRGFLGIWSTGMDEITEQLKQHGIESGVYRNDQSNEIAREIIRERENGPEREPLVLIGHSYGADNALRIAAALRDHHIAVDLVVTLEGAIPPAVPTNVGYEVNIYKPRPLDFLPWWRGVRVENAHGRTGVLEQIDIPRDWPDVDRPDLGHSDVDDDPKIQARIVARVLRFCPTVSQWAIAHPRTGVAMQAGASRGTP